MKPKENIYIFNEIYCCEAGNLTEANGQYIGMLDRADRLDLIQEFWFGETSTITYDKGTFVKEMRHLLNRLSVETKSPITRYPFSLKRCVDLSDFVSRKINDKNLIFKVYFDAGDMLLYSLYLAVETDGQKYEQDLPVLADGAFDEENIIDIIYAYIDALIDIKS